MPGINLFDMITQAQGGAAVRQVSQRSGLSPDMTQMAIKALLPAISAGLQRNVQQPGGLEALLGALQNGNHARYLDEPDVLGRPETIQDGNGILGHLLGSKETSRAVARQAAQKTGIGADILKMLLPIVASMAMGSLSKQSQNKDVMSALMGALSGGQQQPARQQRGGGLLDGLLGGGRRQAPPPPQQSGVMGMLGGLLDADGDGSAMDDIFEMVMKRR